MRIVEQTSTQLRLRSRWLAPTIGWLMFAVPFLMAGFVLLTSVGKLTTLTCDRDLATESQCQFASMGLFGSRVIFLAEGKLQGAKLATTTHQNMEMYRVVLLVDDDELPLTEIWSAETEAEQMTVTAINHFLKSPQQPTLAISRDDRQLNYAIGGILTAIGVAGLLGPLLLMPITVLKLDKQIGQLTQTKRSLLTSKTSTWALQDVETAAVVEQQESDGSAYYQANLQLKSGETIPLLEHRSYRRDIADQTTMTIRNFLNL